MTAMLARLRRDPSARAWVHIWWIATDTHLAETHLTAEESARASRFGFAQDKIRYVASTSGVRKILAGYVGCQPLELPVRRSCRGRPYIDRGAVAGSPALAFSLSHTTGVSLLAVAERAVGVDVERSRIVDNARGIARAFFPAPEAAQVLDQCCGAESQAFLNHWTAKEAYLKRRGVGLSGMRDVHVSCDGGAASARPHIRTDQRARIMRLSRPDLVTALAVGFEPSIVDRGWVH